MASTLTPEILQIIFCQLREHYGPKALLPSTLVCQHWRDVGCRTLCSHVVLTNSNLARFLDCAINYPEHLTAIKSLTLEIQATVLPRWIENAGTRESYRKDGLEETKVLLNQLKTVAEMILPNASSLHTFSLFVSMPKITRRRPRLDYIGFRIDNEVLGQLLRALPTSCVNLEVDTDMSNWSSQKKPHHVCSDLWHVLPQMRHVKLRMQSLCSRMLYINHEDPDDRLAQPDMTRLEQLDEQRIVKADQLRTLNICTRSREGAGPLFVECDFLQRNLDLGVQEPWGRPSTGRTLALAANLAATYRAGGFPNAVQVEISQPWFGMEDDENDPQRKERAQVYRNVMLSRDCMADNTLPQPLRRIDGDGKMLAFYDKTDTCMIGKAGDLLHYAEYSVWRETLYGARMPCCTDSVPSDVRLQATPSFMSREEWQKQSEFVMIGWREGEDHGRKVARVVPLPGADAGFEIDKMPLLEGTQMSGQIIEYFGGYL
ncbi:uncharacterized protein M437DRAFT_63541 [Aureobasidium melanogenum CBS 110374]|uniref:F-box domain-containing protein n=1 Tax=Aureobasidium melanogenum (strain CBS 110374) TaxID=1043003 RepID=A0A074W7W2_AURM1|nr:uncharacterized protein M437DRAFT_63541 [Aureobasidium melanogenum CBS 110374]KEQ66012.1 hypothetical protein M437DRAFT_63541 [Aureobasidium melanogenum CBS 110374]